MIALLETVSPSLAAVWDDCLEVLSHGEVAEFSEANHKEGEQTS